MLCKAGALRGAGSVPGLTAASVLFLSLKKMEKYRLHATDLCPDDSNI